MQRPSGDSMPAPCAPAVVASESIRLTPAASAPPPAAARCCAARCAPTSAEEHAVSTLTFAARRVAFQALAEAARRVACKLIRHKQACCSSASRPHALWWESV